MRHLDLFSGIGGFALAASWVWGPEPEVIAFCEIDPFCQKVLRKHWPKVPIIEDIRDVKGSEFEAVDLLTGGFPCQPFSCAGKQKGTTDSRHLWPEMLRVISEVKPQWIIGENVLGLLRIEGELVFESVCSSLEQEGYEVQPFVVPACAKDAPHRRDRIWIVAHSNRYQQSNVTINGNTGYGELGTLSSSNTSSNGWCGRENNTGCRVERKQSENQIQPGSGWSSQTRRVPKLLDTTNSRSKPLHSTIFTQDSGQEEEEAGFRSPDWFIPPVGTSFPSRFGEWPVLGKPYLVRDSDGIPDVLDRLRALGNAIVPQVAAEIMKAIKQVDEARI